MTQQEALQIASQKARYGHRNWIVWKDRQAVSFHAERLTADSMKRCLLAEGTKGKWVLVCRDRGDYMLGFWRMGLNLIYQCRRGLN